MPSRSATRVSYRSKLRFVAILVLLLISRVVHSEALTPHSARIVSTGLSNFLYPRGTKAFRVTEEREKIPTIRLIGRAHGLGRFDITLTTRRNLVSQTLPRRVDNLAGTQERPILLQGSVALGGGLKRLKNTRVAPVAASILNNDLQLNFEAKRRGYTYLIRAKVGRGDVLAGRISRMPATVGRRGTCHSSTEDVEGNREHLQHRGFHKATESGFKVNATTRIVTLSTDADPEWHQRYGTQSFAKIAQIVNAAEALYYQPLGIGFAIHAQHVYTDSSPYTSYNPGGILEQFVMNPQNPKNLAQTLDLYHGTVDVKHLFTGKDLEGSAVGIAYVGSVCRYPGLSFGVSQDTYEAVAPAVFAHEIAHNLGAFHDLTNSGTLMYPSIVVGRSVSFSHLSIGQIEEYLASNSACLGQEDRPELPTPTPVPPEPVADMPGDEPPGQDSPEILELDITAREMRTNRRLLVVRGRLTSGTGAGVATRPIELYRNRKRVATKPTNGNGRVSFVIARRNTRVVSLSAEDGRAFSRTIGVARELR
jgi:hypothetical protein